MRLARRVKSNQLIFHHAPFPSWWEWGLSRERILLKWPRTFEGLGGVRQLWATLPTGLWRPELEVCSHFL